MSECYSQNMALTCVDEQMLEGQLKGSRGGVESSYFRAIIAGLHVLFIRISCWNKW